MKKIYLSLITICFFLQSFGQVNVGNTAHWVTTGNATVVVSDMNLVNDGAIAAGMGSFKFTGTQNATISGSSMPSFYIVEMAKTNNAKILLNRNINVASSIIFISGQLDLNGNNILLSTGANISGETELNRITGINGGFVEITQNLNSPNGSNPGNLGAFITSTANLGSVTIRRGHTSQSGTGLANSIYRYYNILPTNNSDLNATIRLKYLDAELNDQTETGLVIYQSMNDGANWSNLSQTSRSINSNYVEKTGIESLGLQTLSNDVLAANGVTGLVFTGQRKKPAEVQLKWTSQTETNMSGYQLQRRLDTEFDFIDRGFVNTLAPNGNSISPINYQHIDANAHTGISYYRLKLISTDNSFTYSEEIQVAGKTKGKGGTNNLTLSGGEEPETGRSISNLSNVSKKITVGPNPNNGNFWFTVSGLEKECVAALYTIDGKLVQQIRIASRQQQWVMNLRTGIYLLSVPGFETKKIIVNGGGNAAPPSTPSNSNNKF